MAARHLPVQSADPTLRLRLARRPSVYVVAKSYGRTALALKPNFQIIQAGMQRNAEVKTSTACYTEGKAAAGGCRSWKTV